MLSQRSANEDDILIVSRNFEPDGRYGSELKINDGLSCFQKLVCAAPGLPDDACGRQAELKLANQYISPIFARTTSALTLLQHLRSAFDAAGLQDENDWRMSFLAKGTLGKLVFECPELCFFAAIESGERGYRVRYAGPKYFVEQTLAKFALKEIWERSGEYCSLRQLLGNLAADRSLG